MSLYLAACLWPAAVNAQTWNPTASDPTHNTAAGTGALSKHTLGGHHNTACGRSALFFNTTGNYNTASGAFALLHNTIGSDNTASGYNALNANTTGGLNTAYGAQALQFNTAGGINTASGVSALTSNTTGNGNTASGYTALAGNTEGNTNTATGVSALYANTTGSNNTAVGYNTLINLTAGGSNIALGARAGKNLETGSGNIYVGSNGAASGSESNVIRIGQQQTKAFIAGIKGVPLSGATVVVRPSGQLGVVASSARYKTGIRDLTGASERLAQLRPVSYRYKSEPGVTHYGLIAEEVDRVMPELVVRDEENRPETVQYHELIPLLLQQVKQQRAQIERLTARVDELSRARLAAR